MKHHRIWALVLRYYYYTTRNWDKIFDSFYWPLLDLTIWGLTSLWFIKTRSDTPQFMLVILAAIVLWRVTFQASFEISINFLEESWNRNLVNLFCTPLTKWEWLAAVMFIGIIKACITASFAILIVWMLYEVNVLSIGLSLIPFLVLLVVSGWFIGLVVVSIIIYFGPRVQTLAWSFPFLFGPLSAVFCPREVLPYWAQDVASVLPMTYIFEGMRRIAFTGVAEPADIYRSILLNVIYLGAGLLLFSFGFEKRRVKGFERME